MNDVIHQLFGFFNDKYYAMDDCDRIVIPTNLDYKSSAVVTKIHEDLCEAEIDAYQYHSDVMTDSNSERVKYMKDYLLGEKVKDIEKIQQNFVVGISYTLYNKDGKVVRSGTSEVDAQWCMPIILDDIKEGNTLEYRKGIILDGRIEICIPDTVRYGIRAAMNQHPYILRINEIFALATNGGYKYITETGSQLDTADDCHCGASTSLHAHARDAHYKVHHHNGLCDVNFNSCFVTNAKIGTTIIDSVVAPAELESPIQYEKIDLARISLGTSDFTIKLDHKLKHIIVNLEVFVDNLNEVYDRNDIAKLLEYNAGINSEEETNNEHHHSHHHCGSCCGDCVTPPEVPDKEERPGHHGHPDHEHMHPPDVPPTGVMGSYP